jgi:hypothetical protein
LELKERYAAAAMLYFSPNRHFLLIYATVIQAPTWEEISVGDGRDVYLGTWNLHGKSIHVKFHLVSRTIVEEGETIPGPIENQEILPRNGALLFKNNRFKPDKKLEGALKTILQDETARHATPVKSNP